MKPLAVAFIALRVLTALLVDTYFSPDEFWQALEVAHFQVFAPDEFRLALQNTSAVAHATRTSVGYLTWEWRHMIRGSVYPQIFSTLYWLLRSCGMDTRWAVC